MQFDLWCGCWASRLFRSHPKDNSMTGYRMEIPLLHEHAAAIGYVCMCWASLERRLHHCLAELGAFSTEEIGECITAETDLRARISMLRGVAFIKKPDIKWYDAFTAVLNRIDNEMRIERNRYIHDLWLHANLEAAIKRSFKVEVSRPQAFQRELATAHDKPVTADDIWNFVYRIERVNTLLTLFVKFDARAYSFVETWS
jgi:hypothetical protein